MAVGNPLATPMNFAAVVTTKCDSIRCSVYHQSDTNYAAVFTHQRSTNYAAVSVHQSSTTLSAEVTVPKLLDAKVTALKQQNTLRRLHRRCKR